MFVAVFRRSFFIFPLLWTKCRVRYFFVSEFPNQAPCRLAIAFSQVHRQPERLTIIAPLGADSLVVPGKKVFRSRGLSRDEQIKLAICAQRIIGRTLRRIFCGKSGLAHSKPPDKEFSAKDYNMHFWRGELGRVRCRIFGHGRRCSRNRFRGQGKIPSRKGVTTNDPPPRGRNRSYPLAKR